jgi:predicted nucleic acid-binding protein
MAVKVVDASAVAALLFGEFEASGIADELGDSRLVAPALLEYEVGNTCWKKCRRYPDAAPSFVQAMGLMSNLALTLHDVYPAGVLVIANERGVTFYDASYLWLAETLGAPLVSLDQRLLAARR